MRWNSRPNVAASACGQRGLAEARQVFDEQVSTGEQRDEGEAHFVRLAEQERIDLRLRAVKGVAVSLALACSPSCLRRHVVSAQWNRACIPPQPECSEVG